MRKLEVAIVAPSFQIPGGYSVQAAQLLHAWDADPEVHAWLVPTNPALPRLLQRGSRLKAVSAALGGVTYAASLLRSLARADVVHAFWPTDSSFLAAALPVMAVARAHHRPVVLNVRSGEAAAHLARSRFARRWIARARTVVPSKFTADLVRRVGLDATVTPDVIDVNRFAFRERFPLSPRLLSTCALTTFEDVACTLTAFKAVQREFPEARLTLFEAGVAGRALRELIDELDLRHVACLDGVAPEDVPHIYAGHDIYIRSSQADTTPFLEAFASGLPAISIRPDVDRRMLRPCRPGLLACANDPSSLAEALFYLLNDPHAARAMARSAHESMQQHTWSSLRDRWLEVYRSVLCQPQLAGAKASR